MIRIRATYAGKSVETEGPTIPAAVRLAAGQFGLLPGRTADSTLVVLAIGEWSPWRWQHHGRFRSFSVERIATKDDADASAVVSEKPDRTKLTNAHRKTPMRTFTLSPEADAALTALAEAHKTTRSAVVDALARYVRGRPGVLAAALEQDRRRGRNDG